MVPAMDTGYGEEDKCQCQTSASQHFISSRLLQHVTIHPFQSADATTVSETGAVPLFARDPQINV
jgi:hypothetical protein